VSAATARHTTIEQQLREGKTREAFRAVSALVADGHDDRDTLLLLGRAQEQAGHWLHAAQTYETLVGRDRADEEAASRLIVALIRSGRPQLAVAVAEDLGLATAQSTPAIAARVALAEAADDAGEALALRRELAARRPDDPDAAAALALALARANEHVEAAEVLAAARERHAGDPALRQAAVLLSLEQPGPVDLEPWVDLTVRGGTDQAMLAEAVAACVRRGDAKLAVRLLAGARLTRLTEPIPHMLLALLAQRGPYAERTVQQLVRALPAIPAGGWTRLFKPLVREGRYNLARALLEELEARRPGDPGLESLRAIARRLPDEVELPPEVAGKLASGRPLVAIRAPGAVATVVVFAGNVGASQLLHAHLAPRRVNVIHLRHFKPRLYFLDGIPGEADGYAGVVELLDDMRLLLGGPLYVVGQGISGFAAIRSAIDVEADGVLGLNAPTDLSPAFVEAHGGGPSLYPRIAAELPEMAVSLAPLLAASARPPRIRLYYNADGEPDAAQARRLAGAPSVSLHPVPGGDGPNVLFPMVSLGLLDEALDGLLGA
jgi:tetratricopeptide (TPR) repeat protein